MVKRGRNRLTDAIVLALVVGITACDADTSERASDVDDDTPDIGADSADITSDLGDDTPDAVADLETDADMVAETGDDPAQEPSAECLDSPVDTTLPEPDYYADPCVSPGYWPLTLGSEQYPFLIHFRPGQESIACEIRDILDRSWRIEVDEVGFRPPLPDSGLCGPDERFDVFVWTGIDEAYAYAFGENPETEWDDWLTYMVVDPLGVYGGEILDVTVAHEFNHACQAADDWWESPFVFEMTAVFIEDVVFDDDNNYVNDLADFQSHPDWSLDRDDGYETWYMYSAALYLHFLSEHVFDGDAGFAAEMWLRSRSDPGPGGELRPNEPDFVDALDAILTESAGMTFVETVPVFARWRWYTGDQDDGLHFEEGALFPADAAVTLAAQVTADAGRVDVSPRPMLLGNAYIEVSSETADSFTVSLDGDDTVRWVVQAVPGIEAGSDGDIVDLSDGYADIELTSDGLRTLIVTALPKSDYDPDRRTDQRYRVTLTLSPTSR